MTGLAAQLLDLVDAQGPDLASAALLVARIDYPRLDAGAYLGRLDALGDEACRRIDDDPGHDAPLAARVDRLSRYLHGELGFRGNVDSYEDPRNSCLNQVLDRRTGIPITLSIVYLEVARRAGITGEGVGFPGHFLLRLKGTDGADAGRDVLVDAFGDGALLDDAACRALLRAHAGPAADVTPEMLEGATRRDVVVRMLHNLKRIYVRMRSFPQARLVTDLLVTLAPSSASHLRDRGLLAYHMEDFAAALRDLERYMTLTGPDGPGDARTGETAQTWEHVKTLRRRLAGFN